MYYVGFLDILGFKKIVCEKEEKDILNKELNLRRPSKKTIKKSKDMIREARKVINLSKDDKDKSEFEGNDEKH